MERASPFFALSVDQTLDKLQSRTGGLSTDEASERLSKFGPNLLPRKKAEGPIKLLWNQINNPLIWVLIGSAAVAILADPEDGLKNGLVILAVVVLNTLIGFFQEYRAGQAIESLTQMVPEFAKVLRDKRQVLLPASGLVPGDIVLLASGDKVPADMRIIESRSLKIEEAALTGESVPVEKNSHPVKPESSLGDRASMVFGGTLVTYGTATAVVTATGSDMELGRISELINESMDLQTPLTKGLEKVGKWLTASILLLSAALLALGTWRTVNEVGIEIWKAFLETVIFAITLAVGAIPEGLPAIVTIALAVGVRRMAHRRAIVRKLPAVETLGSTTVICSDKTGTLTRNEMTVQEVWTPEARVQISGVGYEPIGSISDPANSSAPELEISESVLHVLKAGVLCNDAHLHHEGERWTITGDPTEGALLTSYSKALKTAGACEEFAPASLRKSRPRLDVIPFESENQFMVTLHDTIDGTQRQGQKVMLMKGAPEAVIRHCSDFGRTDENTVLREVNAMASRGLRVLAFAEKVGEPFLCRLPVAESLKGFRFLGLQAMIDPPRQEAIDSVRACQSAGITVKMITGDHIETAQAVGRQLGILDENGKAYAGIRLANMNEDEIMRAALEGNVFARVAPEDKLRLVKALQRAGHIVAMTGDGVNDAPALKQSNIGVAMGITGTSVSKESADIVLIDDNFATIRAAVEEGRRVYDNLVKSLAFVLPTNLGLALILVYAVLFFPFQDGELLLPMLPAQILWINLVAAVALALPLAFETKEPDIMSRPPRPPQKPILDSFVIGRTTIAAILMTAGAVGLFSYEYATALADGYTEVMALAEAQTMAVTTVISFQIFYMLNCRSLRKSIFKIGLFTNKIVFIGVGALITLQAAFIYLPPMQRIFGTTSLDLQDLSFALLVGALIFPVIGIIKWIGPVFGSRW